MRLHLAVLFFLLFIAVKPCFGQLSFGGAPIFIDHLKSSNQDIPFVEMPEFNISDEPNDNGLENLQFRFAHPFFVNLIPDNCGKWWVMPDGSRVWRVGIRSKGAYSINLVFDQFKIPDGGKLFIYNTNHTQITGAYTNQSHLNSDPFNPQPVAGDEIIVEYIEPVDADFSADIEIGAVNHDYKGLFGLKADLVGSFGDSGDCNPDMSCNQAEFDVQRAVCKLIVDGTGLCTGTILNNVRNDGIPYLITAAHCLKKNLSNHSFLFFFNYQVPNCNGQIEGVKSQSLSGAQILVKIDTMDVILVQMSQLPPSDFRPYWAGWSLATAPVEPMYLIHHPSADVKKYALSVNAPQNASFLTHLFLADSHWRIAKWERGTSEGGSSGGGLLDSNHHLVGTLSGGSSECGSPFNDYFARFNKAWAYYSNSDSQLKKWLDPDNTGVTSLEGIDFYEDEKVQRLSNFQEGDLTVGKDPANPTIGYWFGHNNTSTQGFAEIYSQIDSATIRGIYLMVAKSPIYSNESLNLKLWSEKPFTEADMPVFDSIITLSSLNDKSENLISLPIPVRVKYPVSLTIEFNTPTYGDSIGFYWQYSTSRTRNTSYLKANNLWSPFYQVHPQQLNTSSYIDLLVADAHLSNRQTPPEPASRIIVYQDLNQQLVHFKWGIDKLEFLDIYTINGAFVTRSKYGYTYGDEVFNTSNLAAGVYVFKFTFSGFTQIQKILVGN